MFLLNFVKISLLLVYKLNQHIQIGLVQTVQNNSVWFSLPHVEYEKRK